MPSVSHALAKLADHHRQIADLDMNAEFARDPGRFERLSAHLDDLMIDYSKCAVSDQTMTLLFELADSAGVEARRDAMFAGEVINSTENRAVLHVALRNPAEQPVLLDGHDVMPEIHAVLERMSAFSTAVRSGALTGHTGQKITDIVNIGIGGSDLGPAMTVLALAPYHDGPRCHFVSNIDAAHITDTLAGLSPETTLFIIASKTFTTIETMTNARTARRWIVEKLGESAIGDHFVAVSTALDKVSAFGIADEHVFGFWDWVGGRYSIWSAIGLPLMLAIGPTHFRALLAGGHELDQHFCTAPMAENLPILLGLIGVWHRLVCHYPTRAIIPYDQRLARLPAYLQQLDMESNGKRVSRDGERLDHPSGPIVWGEPGTNGQHAFFQLLHQGTDIIPVEFILAARGHEADLDHHHALLVSNCLAQSQALMHGRSALEARRQLLEKGFDAEEAERLGPHREFPGNRPSLTILYDQLTPFALGRLIALYEHRVFVEAQIYGINAFDQWGVELGKELATALLPVVEGKAAPDGLDASTAGLINAIRQMTAKA